MTGHQLRLAILGSLAAGLALVAGVWSTSDRPAAAPTAIAPDGEQVFLAKGCGSCHAVPGRPSPLGGEMAPNLGLLPLVAGERVAGLDAEAYVRQSIREPRAYVVPGFLVVSMPLLPVSDAELDALVEYLLGSPS